MAQDNSKTFTISDNAAALFQHNPQLQLSAANLRAIDRGRLIYVDAGCIQILRYQNSDGDLNYVRFDSGKFLSSTTNAVNLKDFDQTLQTAANHGFRVTYCLNTATNKLLMVNLYPCRCKCKRK